MIKWTDEQQMAIDERNCDLLVAAAAGAGKTAVLVERIIRRIIRDDKPIDIDNMLIVTFTNAAASEMRERIALALDKAIEENPNSHRLQRQLLLLPKAGITTIHSFCMDVLKNNYHKVGLAPDFRIADETESVLLKIESIEELFENQYEEGSKNFYKLLDSYSGNKGDNKLKDMVLEIYNFVQSTPWPEEWLNKRVEEYKVTKDFDFIKTKWAKIIIELVDIELSGCLNLLEKAYKVALMGDGLEKCADQLAYDIEYAKTLFHKEGNNWDDLYKTFNNFKMERQK
ncbi:MAG: UvrD-helicase domain-containing protein, partial [Firmicutes bacterium]|nr:UvrD-helicase domain-containing protein [Bacillota bacterium]